MSFTVRSGDVTCLQQELTGITWDNHGIAWNLLCGEKDHLITHDNTSLRMESNGRWRSNFAPFEGRHVMQPSGKRSICFWNTSIAAAPFGMSPSTPISPRFTKCFFARFSWEIIEMDRNASILTLSDIVSILFILWHLSPRYSRPSRSKRAPWSWKRSTPVGFMHFSCALRMCHLGFSTDCWTVEEDEVSVKTRSWK